MVRDTMRLREPRVNPTLHLAQSKSLAEGALEHYNRRREVKFELVDVMPCISIPEPRCCYTHINFTARSSKDGSKEFFFAELYHCRRRSSRKGLQEASSVIGRKLVPRGFTVTCCEPLGSDSFVGRKLFKRDDTSGVRKNSDFTYCYGCTQVISHPKGEKYVAGHCNTPYIYESVR